MPRRKHWRKLDSKRRERSRTDKSETAVRLTSCSRKSIHHGGRKSIQLGGNWKSIQRSGNWKSIQRGGNWKSIQQGGNWKPIQRGGIKSLQRGANHSISQENQRNYQTNISQLKQAIIDFKSIVASDSYNTQTNFDIVFLYTFPDVATNYQSKDNKELSERESIAVCPVNTSQQNEDLDRNVTAQHNLSSDPLEICSDNDVACYHAKRSSERLWNASDLVFGSFHQNDGSFLSILEDVSAHVMHRVCWHMHLVVM